MVKRFLHKLLGDKGERAAARFLKSAGYRIIAHSYRNQFGEIDLIAMDGNQVVFTEVKTRASDDRGQPYEAVDKAKQTKLTKLALVWLKKHKRLDKPARFDVISIIWPPESSAPPQIQHFINAFEATGKGQFWG